MKQRKTNDLLDQINRTIPMIKKSYHSNPLPMLADILKSYKEAKRIIEKTPVNDLKKEMFHIKGGTRAYLEAANDYMNPMLEEMNKTEKIFEKVF